MSTRYWWSCGWNSVGSVITCWFLIQKGNYLCIPSSCRAGLNEFHTSVLIGMHRFRVRFVWKYKKTWSRWPYLCVPVSQKRSRGGNQGQDPSITIYLNPLRASSLLQVLCSFLLGVKKYVYVLLWLSFEKSFFVFEYFFLFINLLKSSRGSASFALHNKRAKGAWARSFNNFSLASIFATSWSVCVLVSIV